MKVRFSYCPILEGHLKCFIYHIVYHHITHFNKKNTYFLSPPNFGKKKYCMAQYLKVPLFID